MLRALCILLLACISLADVASADPVYHLYGISPQNQLVEINPSDLQADQRVVGTFTAPLMKGLDFDPGLNRILGIDVEGVLYEINQNTAAASPLTGFGGSMSSFSGLAFDITAPVPELFVPGSDFQGVPVVLRAEGREPFEQITFYPSFDDMLYGITVDTTQGGTVFTLLGSLSGTPLRRIAILDRITGSMSELPVATDNLTGLAVHPQTGILYGATSEGTLLSISKSSGASTVLRSYPSTFGVAVSDLAFIPVTPTPSPTPTATFTPTPTATPCASGSLACGCDQTEVTLQSGEIVCAPLNTLTKRTVPDAPIVTTQGNRVTLLLEDFSAASDGASVDVLSATSAAIATEALGAAAARRKISIRYDVTLRNTSSRTRDAINKQSKRNQVSFRKLAPGRYTARYRVKLMRGKKLVGTSKYSPRTKFKVSARRKG